MSMSTRETINAKPSVVKIVLKVFMTKDSLDNPGFDYEELGRRALDKWDRVLESCAFKDLDESFIAQSALTRLKTTEGWETIIAQDLESEVIH